MTSRTRKLTAGAVALGSVIAVAAWSLRPRGYTYQGNTVEQWFKGYVLTDFRQDYRRFGSRSAFAAPFKEMGTNAAPYLATRITQDFSLTRLEQWSYKLLPGRFRGAPKVNQAYAAALLLGEFVQPSEDMLKGLLESVLFSTNHAAFVSRALKPPRALWTPFTLERTRKLNPHIFDKERGVETKPRVPESDTSGFQIFETQ